MLITVRDALGFEIFQRSGASIAAGSAGLDREIRWVHAAEVPEIADLLVGGELLLTTGMGLGNNLHLQKRFIHDLAAVGVAGIVLQLGRTFNTVPPAMVSAAEVCRMPLIVLPTKTRFVEITRQLHSAIVSHEYQMLEKAEKIGRKFTELVLHGGGLRQIIHLLSEIVENPVVLEDSAHQLIEFAAHAYTVDEVLRTWEAHSRRGHKQRQEAGVTIQEGNPPCAWMSIVVSNEARARVHVLALGRSLDEMDELATDRAAAALGFALLAQKDAAHLANHARGGLLIDLLNRRYGSASEVLRRAKALGADLQSRQLAPLVVEALELSNAAGESGRSQEDRQRIVVTMLDEVNIAISRSNCAGLCAVEGERVLAVVGLPGDQDVDTAIDAVGSEACRRITGRLPGIDPIVGVSGEAPLDSLGQAFEEAREAVRYGMQVARKRGVYHFGGLGLRSLLLRLSEGPELARYVERQLGPVLDHDASSVTPLLDTLRAYIHRGGNKARTARDLNLERHSLYYRLGRIAELLGKDLEDPAACVRLSVALQGLDVIQGTRSQIPARVKAHR